MQNNEYETTDLGLAAALTASSIQLVRIDKNNPRRALFVFNNSAQVRDYVRKYWQDEMFVSAMAYNNALKHLKARLYS